MGGQPVFGSPLHVGCPNIGNMDRLNQLVADILDRRWLTNNGKYVQAFEREIQKLTGARHCIAVTNGTIALELLVKALDLTGEVIVPSFTFAATPHALQWHGVKPVFCDIDPETHNINPSEIEALITPETSGIIGVHVWGRACDNDKISSIATKHGLKLMYDSAHAFACSSNGEMIGNFGDAEAFSFHATKFLNTFEGGAVVTNDDQIAERVRLMRNFGFGPGFDNVVCVGTNAKMTEFSAAMGITSLESIDDFISINRRNYNLYKEYLRDIPSVELIKYSAQDRNNYQYIVLELDSELAGLTRDRLIEILHAENILARRYFHPGCHKIEPYISNSPNAYLKLEQTELLTTKVICLPTGTAVGEEDVFKICNVIKTAIEHSDKISHT